MRWILEIVITAVVILLGRWYAIRSSVQSTDYAVEKLANARKCENEFRSAEELLPIMAVGDLIECGRIRVAVYWDLSIYDHWGAHVGEGQVVHLVPNGKKGTEIRLDHISAVAHGGKCRVNNLEYFGRVRGLVRRDGALIAEKAMEQWRLFNEGPRTLTYDLMESNCEHFVTLIAYGTPFSVQTENIKTKDVISQLGSYLGTSVNYKFERKDEKDSIVRNEDQDQEQ